MCHCYFSVIMLDRTRTAKILSFGENIFSGCTSWSHSLKGLRSKALVGEDPREGSTCSINRGVDFEEADLQSWISKAPVCFYKCTKCNGCIDTANYGSQCSALNTKVSVHFLWLRVEALCILTICIQGLIIWFCEYCTLPRVTFLVTGNNPHM